MDMWQDVPELVGDIVRLRPMLHTDRDGVLAAAADGDQWKLFYTAVPGPDSIDAYLDRAAAELAAHRSMPFVVERDGVVVGATRYMRMNETHRRLEIGTTFYAQSHQRSGVNTECKLLLLAHAFEEMDAVCVQLRTDRFNVRSQRAIERLGAQRDGVLRGHTVMPDGRVRDTVVYSILAHEWVGVRTNLEHLLSA
jgi:RimJ/RimL family protein N-acetyltransferase